MIGEIFSNHSGKLNPNKDGENLPSDNRNSSQREAVSAMTEDSMIYVFINYYGPRRILQKIKWTLRLPTPVVKHTSQVCFRV